MHFRLLPLILAAVVAGAGCSPRPAPQQPEGDVDQAMSVMVRPEVERALDIGDVEADVNLEITLPPVHNEPGLTAEEMRTTTGDLALTTINVPYPPPDSITLHCEMRYSNDYGPNPVTADIRLRREDAIIANEGGILAGRWVDHQLAFTVDVLEGLEEAPETLLVHAEVELAFFPDENRPAQAMESTVKFSNPVRINFEGPPTDLALPEPEEDLQETDEGANADEAAEADDDDGDEPGAEPDTP